MSYVQGGVESLLLFTLTAAASIYYLFSPETRERASSLLIERGVATWSNLSNESRRNKSAHSTQHIFMYAANRRVVVLADR